MTIYDISEKAGVSIATVSRVLNGSPKVAAATRERVMKVIEEEQYTPNVFAQGLNSNVTRSIGILYSDASDLYLANAVYQLERAFRARGYDAVLCCCGYEQERRMSLINWVIAKKVDAVVLAGSHFVEEFDRDNDYLREISGRIPLAILSGKLYDPDIICSYCDDYQTMFDLTLSLFAGGSEKIVFLHTRNSDSVRRKIAGIREAYHAHGGEFPAEYDLLCPEGDIAHVSAFIREAHRRLRFDTVLCMDDSIAVGVLKYAQAAGISVPGELRIAGYNDSVLSRCTTPELTTADNRTEELCEALAAMVTDRLAGKPAENTKYMLPGKLIFRETT